MCLIFVHCYRIIKIILQFIEKRVIIIMSREVDNVKDKYIKKLEKCGVDYREGLARFMDEEELFDGLLMNFLTENSFDEAKRCIDSGDLKGAEYAVHAMKSVTGTLSMNKLFKLCSRTMDAIRDCDTDVMRTTFSQTYKNYLEIAKLLRTIRDASR